MLAVFIFTILTTFVLLAGLVSMALGKNFSKKYGTKLMSLRVFFQLLTILALIVAYLIGRN